MNKDKAKYVKDASNKLDDHVIEKDVCVTDKAQSIEKKEQSIEKISTKEINGPKGLEPTRYGDWESKGRCYDF